MTKQQYFEMCEMLGSQPVDAEIPVELDDFPVEVQQAFLVYRMLRDEWEGFNGLYLGKSYQGLTEILEYSEVDLSDRNFIVKVIRTIDNIRQDQYNKKREQEQKARELKN
jgi:hypothetical protein